MNMLTPRHTAFSFSSLFAAMVGIASFAAAQCTNPWQASDGLPGFSDRVHASCTWDPDGAGPLTPRIVFGGDFTMAGDIVANRIVAWDPVTGEWFPFADGFNTSVRSLLVRQNGDLIAGGLASPVSRWTGSTWQALGPTPSNGPFTVPYFGALAELPNGDLIAGGSFFVLGGVVNSIARWNGTSWSPLGGGLTTATGQLGHVGSLAVMGNGDVVAAGTFANAGGVGVNNVARWNGASWSALGAGSSDRVFALQLLPNGDLVAGGGSAWFNPVTMSRWNGTQWTPFGATLGNGFVNALELLPNGDLVAAGQFDPGNLRHVARWNGTNWSPMGAGMAGNVTQILTVRSLSGGDVVVAGAISGDFGGGRSANAARWNGATWSPIASGFDGPIRAIARRPNGNVVVTGTFATAGGAYHGAIAEWNGTAWQSLGTGLGGFSLAVDGGYALALLPNGDLVVGGRFTAAGGVNVSHIARWDGAAWHALGAGPGLIGEIRALTVLANGDLVAASSLSSGNVMRWDGVTWSPLGGTFDGPVLAVGELTNGDIVATGAFNNVGAVPAASIARWDGTAWSPFGSGLTLGAGQALAVEPNGAFVVSGSFSAAGGVAAANIARWDGTAWSPLSTGLTGAAPFANEVFALARHGNGDLIAAGRFAVAGGVSAANIARWNGTAWSGFGLGTNELVFALSALPSGDVLVGGNFLRAGGEIRPQFATVTTTCPASVQSVGAACAGAGGLNVLAATTPPWTGTTFRATATGMPSNAFVLSIYGFTPLSVPIAALIPQGLPGCDVHVTTDFAEVLLPVAGSVQTQLPLPGSATFAGLVLRHYVVPFELDPTLAVQAITSSNALSLTLGTF